MTKISQIQEPIFRLPLARYRLSFQAMGEVRLSEFTGSAWRGGLGHALKTLACTHQTVDGVCAQPHECVYAQLFETPMPPNSADRLWNADMVPHPFILEIPPIDQPQILRPGTTHHLGLILFGEANQYFPLMINALAMAGRDGVGTGRGSLALMGVDYQPNTAGETWRSCYVPGQPYRLVQPTITPVPPIPERVRLTIKTPMTLKRDGKTVIPSRFAFHDLFRSLLRRCYSLLYLHAGQQPDLDLGGLSKKSREAPIHDVRLSWRQWQRYSSRKQTGMKSGGLIGQFHLNGADLGPFWPWLWAGQNINAGKGTVMGLGRYEIQEA